MVIWLPSSGPVVRQKITVGSTWRSITAHLMVTRSRKKRRGQVQNIPFKGTALSDLLPLRTHLPKLPSPPIPPLSYGFINELTHWWGQSPHNPITSQRPYLWTLLHLGPSLQHMNLGETFQIPAIRPGHVPDAKACGMLTLFVFILLNTKL